MQRRLIVAILVLVAGALAVFTIPVARNSADLLRENQAEVALREARTVAGLQGVLLGTDTTPERAEQSRAAIAQLRALLEVATGGRVELIDRQGAPTLGREVLDPQEPALQAALAGQEKVFRRADSVIGQPALEVTVPARDRFGDVVGAVRLTYPTEPVDEQIHDIWTFRAVTAAVTLLVAALAAIGLSRLLTKPLRELDAMAARLSAGDFRARVPEQGPQEIQRLARTLNNGARQLGTLVESQQRFIADASHQLRTPLTALRLHLDNLQDQVDSRAARDAIDRAIAEVVRMTRLVNDLLVLARAEARTTSARPIDLARLIADRAASWAAAAEAHLVSVTTSVEPAQISARAGDLEQILDNLLANALREAPEESQISVTVTVDRDGVDLLVADQGPGMTEMERQRAFERFWRGHPGGTGLGLTIVRQLVEDNGGTIELLSNQPQGLAVRMRFPAVASAPETSSANPSGQA